MATASSSSSSIDPKRDLNKQNPCGCSRRARQSFFFTEQLDLAKAKLEKLDSK